MRVESFGGFNIQKRQDRRSRDKTQRHTHANGKQKPQKDSEGS